MIVTALTVTSGRTAHLQEALACFAAQDYAEKRMVILNTFPKQKLTTDVPNVRIINCEARPDSLGEARNLAVAVCEDGAVIPWDDDDLYLPHHLRLYAEAFEKTGAAWIRAFPVWYSEQWKIGKMFNTWVNAVAFQKWAWRTIQGYPAITVGEDQAFFSKLSQLKGASLELQPKEISAIYCFGNNAYHVSGKGPDKPDEQPAWVRYQKDLDRRVANGLEPVGDIKLVPTLKHDPRVMVAEFLGEKEIKRPKQMQTTKDPVCFVQLGRYGDIINVLPLFYHCAQTYDIPHVMVSQEFADIFDGVSYVIPEVVPLRNDMLVEGLSIARKKFKHVINCGIWGRRWNQQRRAPAFNIDAWINAGFGYLFDDFSRYPVFDLRDRAREERYASKLFLSDRNHILVNVTSKSSPFKNGQKLLEQIREQHGEYAEVVDITGLHVDHVYDLLGAIERAAVVVSVDTSLVHLTAGTLTPLVCIVPNDWTGSVPRLEDKRMFTYTEMQAMIEQGGDNAFHQAIRDTGDRIIKGYIPLDHAAPSTAPQRLIYHVCERHPEKNAMEARRKRTAQESWDVLYRTGNVIPAHYWEPYKRNAKQDLGDPRALPYLKDVFEVGMNQAGDEDIILFTNDDNWLHPKLPALVQLHCSLWGVCCSQRCEFVEGPILRGSAPPEAFAMAGRLHMGRDLFAFTKRWLVAHWDEIPDFVIGCSDWDLCLAGLVRRQWGIASTRQNIEDSIWPAELVRGYISHQYHPPKWRDPNYETVAPGQIHNRALFRAWGDKYMPSLKFHEGNVI